MRPPENQVPDTYREEQKLLRFLRAYLKRHRFAPSFEEMRAALGLVSKSQVHRLVRGLEARGEILCERRRARRISLARLALCPKCGAAFRRRPW